MTELARGDVLLVATEDGGDLNLIGGQVEMTAGFDTAVYLALFGGNADGSAYWGDVIEDDPTRRYPARTQTLLRGLPAVSGNLRKIEDAARSDLAWFVDLGIADSLDVVATMPALNRITISGAIVAEGVETNFSYTANWKAA